MTLDKIFKCESRKKIVSFFYQNSTAVDTLRGIVTWTGLSEKEVVKALEELVDSGILIAHRTSGTVGYAYTSDKKLIKDIKNYFQKSNKMGQ